MNRTPPSTPTTESVIATPAHLDDRLEEGLRETFPASDPLAVHVIDSHLRRHTDSAEITTDAEDPDKRPRGDSEEA